MPTDFPESRDSGRRKSCLRAVWGNLKSQSPVKCERMNHAMPKSVTQLLVAWGDGDQTALDQLVPLVNEELRRLARGFMRRERPGHTLQTTALVNEAYLRLVDQKHMHWQNRAHFLAIAAQLMRRILVDYARRRQY